MLELPPVDDGVDRKTWVLEEFEQLQAEVEKWAAQNNQLQSSSDVDPANSLTASSSVGVDGVLRSRAGAAGAAALARYRESCRAHPYEPKKR